MSQFEVHDTSFEAHLTPPSRRVEPTVITQAEPSYDDQLKARKKRYLITMGLRVPLLIAATLTYQHLWIAIPLLLISIPLPWMAVLIANDRPARKRAKKVVPGVINYEKALPPGTREIVDGE
ncbi:DUF3099 domain-containing protein [Nakamurella panacisegetis]|nr:DUF3099 domain-containing protein [Nakamurella panacisegetis]